MAEASSSSKEDTLLCWTSPQYSACRSSYAAHGLCDHRPGIKICSSNFNDVLLELFSYLYLTLCQFAVCRDTSVGCPRSKPGGHKCIHIQPHKPVCGLHEVIAQ